MRSEKRVEILADAGPAARFASASPCLAPAVLTRPDPRTNVPDLGRTCNTKHHVQFRKCRNSRAIDVVRGKTLGACDQQGEDSGARRSHPRQHQRVSVSYRAVIGSPRARRSIQESPDSTLSEKHSQTRLLAGARWLDQYPSELGRGAQT